MLIGHWRYTGYLLMNDENIITLNKVLHETCVPNVLLVAPYKYK